MRKSILIFLLGSLFINAQVGINTKTPNSTLAVNGSMGADYKQITAASYTLTATDHYVTYNGTTNTTFTLPAVGSGASSFTGRIYKIKNISTSAITIQASGGNTLRIDNTPVSSFVIPTGAYAEVVNNSNTSGVPGIFHLRYFQNQAMLKSMVFSYQFLRTEQVVRG